MNASLRTGESAETPVRRSGRQRWMNAAKLAAFAAVMGFVGWALVDRIRAVSWREVHFAPTALLGAVLAMSVAKGLFIPILRQLTSAFHPPPPWAVISAIALVPPLGKYAPGKVASFVGAIWLFRRHGIPHRFAASVMVLLPYLTVLAALLIALPLTFSGPVSRALPGGWAIVLGLVAAGAFLLHPRIYGAAANFLLRRLGREPMDRMPPMRDYIIPAGLLLVHWGMMGLSLWLLARSLGSGAPGDLPLFIGASASAIAVGFAAVFAPAGLGVREGVYLLILEPALGPTAAVLVVATRLLETLVDVGLAGLGTVLLKLGPAPPAVDDERE